ncbi:MAG: CRISPR-associated endonuclease Cas2 [Chitinophagaceae bacterium]|nr:CRISPR-associated endonuclease Cas2 [Chitinophagaceae bacterium]
MAKPKSRIYTLKEKIAIIKHAGIKEVQEVKDLDPLASLPERIAKILGIVNAKPQKSTTMTYLLTYDIADDKVRKLVSKFLLSRGCIRIQKSVFMANTEHRTFSDIHSTLKDIVEYYENEDSIILVPINVSDVRSMKLIGKNVNIETLANPPNTIFF